MFDNACLSTGATKSDSLKQRGERDKMKLSRLLIKACCGIMLLGACC